MIDSDRLKEKFRSCLGFIQRSCEDFDGGQRDEAVRIALQIRILIHDTPRSTSLLTHLDMKRQVMVLTTCVDIHAQMRAMGVADLVIASFQGMAMTRVGPEGAELRPGLGCGGRGDFVNVEEWWKQVVWAFSPQRLLTRRAIVLGAANTDGGAHVDEQLSPDYAALADEGAAGSFVVRDGVTTWRGPTIDTWTGAVVPGSAADGESLRDAHLISLRQMGYEILNSPGLLALV